jgi:hypothetical protein
MDSYKYDSKNGIKSYPKEKLTGRRTLAGKTQVSEKLDMSDVWRFWEVLYIIGLLQCIMVQANSDPLDSGEALFDETLHVPGEPFSPIDFQNAESVGKFIKSFIFM